MLDLSVILTLLQSLSFAVYKRKAWKAKEIEKKTFDACELVVFCEKSITRSMTSMIFFCRWRNCL
jgi:hypothetical protein